jgi:hypothetical protein
MTSCILVTNETERFQNANRIYYLPISLLGRILLKLVSNKCDLRLWGGLYWLNIGLSDGISVVRFP